MDKARPIWQELPLHFKRSLVGKLDYKSRCCLRKVSCADRELVDECPVYLASVRFDPPTNSQDSTANLMISEYIVDSEDSEVIVCTRYDESDVISDSLLPFSHRRSLMEEVFFYRNLSRRSEPPVMSAFHAKLMTEIRKNPGLKFRAEKMRWWWETSTGVEFLEAFQLFDPSVLRTLTVEKICEVCINEVVETEQWKNLKHIHYVDRQSIPIKHFLHFHKLHLKFFELDPESVWQLIRSYRSVDRQVGSYFEVTTAHRLNRTGILKKFDVTARSEPIDPEDNGHFQRFPVATGDRVLCVWINAETHSNGHMKGVVCRRDHVQEDFVIPGSWML